MGKINIASPATGLQKVIEIDDEKRLQNLYERRMAQEIDGAVLGEEFAGYILRITGGNDKQGFPMRQGILTNTRVRLLMHKGHKGYRQRRSGERKRKSIRGCIVGQDIAVLNLAIVKRGDDDVTKYVISRTFTNKKGKTVRRAPKIQRFITPLVLQRKRARKAAKLASVLRNKEDKAAYKKIVAQRLADEKEARRSLMSKRRSTRRSQKLAPDA